MKRILGLLLVLVLAAGAAATINEQAVLEADKVRAAVGQVTRIRAQFTTPGQFVWHCHIVEHEDNEMMRPYRIGPEQPGQPMPPAMP